MVGVPAQDSRSEADQAVAVGVVIGRGEVQVDSVLPYFWFRGRLEGQARGQIEQVPNNRLRIHAGDVQVSLVAEGERTAYVHEVSGHGIAPAVAGRVSRRW